MSRAIRRYICFFVGLSVVLFSQGCLFHSVMGPGYAVTIFLSDSVSLEVTDIEFLDHVAMKEGFGSRHVSSSDKWECINYERELSEPEYQGIRSYKFISMGYCYDFEQPLTSMNRKIKQFYINILNDWVGQDPALKQEIDRLADVFYKELSTRFGEENIKMEKRRAGPPF